MNSLHHCTPLRSSRQAGLRSNQNAVSKIMRVAIAVLAIATWHVSTHATELGRLFYTPQERVQLALPQTITTATDAENPDYVVVNGMIQKQGGNRIVWVNGKQQKAGYSNENQPATVPVTLPGKTQPVQVKVGQRLKLDTPVSKPADNKMPATEGNQ